MIQYRNNYIIIYVIFQCFGEIFTFSLDVSLWLCYNLR